MPNRIIREGWIESEAVDKLSVHAERFFIRLCLKADDYGRYHANAQLLRSNLFPLKIDFRSSDVASWLTECEACGLVRTYTKDQKRFVEIVKFGQRVRADVSKFPECPSEDGQVSDVCQTDGSTCPLYSESEAKTESNAKTKSESNPPSLPLVGGVEISQLGQRIGAWFKRRPATVWSPKERKALKALEATNPDTEDVAILEAYYVAAMDPQKDYRRRDLVTLLNNWSGELDRARRWKSSTASTDHSNGF
jgi:hypothetical protein